MVIALVVLLSGFGQPRVPDPLERTAVPTGTSAGFSAQVSRLSPDLKRRMRGNSWHKGCPVALKALRLVRLSFWNFEKEITEGKLVVHGSQTENIVEVFRKMFSKRFPIRRMHLVDRYGGNDNRSMNRDNTSAFNCREVAGHPGVWSQHAYGWAIDINPIENPYVRSDGSVSPEAGEPYADRSEHVKGMIHRKGVVVRSFGHLGWGWGADFDDSKDYQHFSATGS